MGITPAFDTGHIEADLQALTAKVNAIRLVVDGLGSYQENTMVPLIQEVRADAEQLQSGQALLEGAVITGSGASRRTAIDALVDTIEGVQQDAIHNILANQRIITDAETHASNIDASVGTGLGARVSAIQTSVGSGLAAAVAGVLGKVNTLVARPSPRLIRQVSLQLGTVAPTSGWTVPQQVVGAGVLGRSAGAAVRLWLKQGTSSIVTVGWSNDGVTWTGANERATARGEVSMGLTTEIAASQGLWLRFRATQGNAEVEGLEAYLYAEGSGLADPDADPDALAGAGRRSLSPMNWRKTMDWRKIAAWALFFCLGVFASWLCAAHGFCLLFPSPCH